MSKDEYYEELKNAHEFYQDILEHNPQDINKDFKEKYELKSKLFELHQEDRKSRKIVRWVNIIPISLLILFTLWLIYKYILAY